MLRTIFFAASSTLVLAACGDNNADEPPVDPVTTGSAASTMTDSGSDPMMADQDMASDDTAMEEETMEHEHEPLPAAAAGEDMRVDFTGTDGEATGEAIIKGGPNGLLIRYDLMDIGHGFHGVHLHQVGDCSDFDGGFKLSGSHINPEGKEHGLMNEVGYERADLPNIYAHHTGHARGELFVAGLSIEDAMDEDGFALVVHVNPDDHMTQPIGGAGARIACAAFNVM